jgi:formylmethanofuran dehydrogenase subunit E
MLRTARSKASVVILLFVVVGLGSACAAGEGASNQDIFVALERFHGHVCAGSLMGARLGLAAKSALERAGIQGKLKAQYFSLSCPVDGIQITTGTTYGNRALDVQDRNEHRLLLTDEKSGRQVEARLTATADEKALSTREINKDVRALPVESPERKKLEQSLEAIYAWLKTAPESEVITVRLVR